MSNSSLTSRALRVNYETSSGGGGGFGATEGTRSTAGGVGTFACTYAKASAKAYMSFAIRPFGAGPTPTPTPTATPTPTPTPTATPTPTPTERRPQRQLQRRPRRLPRLRHQLQPKLLHQRLPRLQLPPQLPETAKLHGKVAPPEINATPTSLMTKKSELSKKKKKKRRKSIDNDFTNYHSLLS